MITLFIIFTIIDIVSYNNIKRSYKNGTLELPEELKNETLEDYYKFRLWDKMHRIYKRKFVAGILYWGFAPFWVTYLCGVISNFNQGYDFLSCLAYGFLSIMVISFLLPVLVPLGFFIGAVLHPKVLQSILFDEKDLFFDENYLKQIGLDQKQAAESTMLGTSIGAYLNSQSNRFK